MKPHQLNQMQPGDWFEVLTAWELADRDYIQGNSLLQSQAEVEWFRKCNIDVVLISFENPVSKVSDDLRFLYAADR